MYRSDNDKQIGREDYRTRPLQRSKIEMAVVTLS